jgi:hypothetical protein
MALPMPIIAVSDPRTDSSVAKEKPKDSGFPVVSREIVMLKPDDDYFKLERRVRRRKMLEIAKESFRDQMPSIYTLVAQESPPLTYATIKIT